MFFKKKIIKNKKTKEKKKDTYILENPLRVPKNKRSNTNTHKIMRYYFLITTPMSVDFINISLQYTYVCKWNIVSSLTDNFTYCRYLLIEHKIIQKKTSEDQKKVSTSWMKRESYFWFFYFKLWLLNEIYYAKIILFTSFPSLHYASAVEISSRLIHYSLGGHLKKDCKLIQNFIQSQNR